MLVARIEVIGGPQRGARTYAEVRVDADGAPECFLPLADPFGNGAAAGSAIDGPVPAEHARLLAPCVPRVVMGMAHNTGPADRLLAPQAFHKSPHSVIGPGDAIELEPGQDDVDAEGEVAVVIGRYARSLTAADALDAVFGYTIGNDVTDRLAQSTEDRWTEAKSRDTFTPLGPWIRTDLDPSDLPIQLGDEQGMGPQASTSGLARGVVEILVYLTSVMSLHPGDVVLAGAPGPSHRLRPGALSNIVVPAIGRLSNPVRAARPPA